MKTIVFVLLVAIVLSACAPAVTPASATAPATEAPTPVASVPFVHTACTDGVDLTGKAVSFYHILDPLDQVDTVYNPLRVGYADAAEYFNAHGGICGATIEQVFDDTHWGDEQTIYDYYKALDPKPSLIMLYGSGMAVLLADQLAADQIPGLNIRGGSTASAYGDDGQTLGWVFATRPLYADQVGAMCDYIAANPDRFPHPVLGFLNSGEAWTGPASIEARPYCTSLGIGDAGIFNLTGSESDVRSRVQTLIDAGATIIYTNSHENNPALIARTLFEMGLQDKITLTTVDVAMDPYVAFSGETDLGADGLPVINGMLGSMPVRSLAETNNPGIQLITEQADLHQRQITMRTDGYIMGWDTTDLLIEVYIQTGNRVGFDAITGAEIKKTLESIVYAPLGGVMQIDFQGGKRRTLALNRIGEMNYLGMDGKTPAGPGNPPKMVTEGGQKHLVPMIVPLTDYQPTPDLRPDGADVPSVVVLGTVTGRIAFQSNRDGNYEIYVMNGDGSGLTNLTNNPADDLGPVWSPDGNKIAFLTNRDGNYEIYVMNTDGSGPTNLTNNPANEGDGGSPQALDWSPDGEKIAFQTDRDGNSEIYVMNADGSAQTNLTNAPASGEIFPKWSADGKQIGFTTGRDGNDEIYLMSADGSHQTRLTQNAADDAFPCWSPDGKKIVFVNGRGHGRYEINLMDADGSNWIQLTDNPGSNDNNMDACWSPDGMQIIFWSSRDGNAELYVMDADGSHQTRLTDNPAQDEAPALIQP